jgi:hypothetical protein
VRIQTARVGARVSALAFALLAIACGEEGLLPTTVDPGPDFSLADLLFDEGFFYCQVEPRAITPLRCGPGDPAAGDSGCHDTITSFRLRSHLDIACDGNVPIDAIPVEARGNYTNAQARMRRDPNSSPLLLRPLQKLEHPRAVFDTNSDAAAVIREWANHVTTQ